jgi:hypothetical protein
MFIYNISFVITYIHTAHKQIQDKKTYTKLILGLVLKYNANRALFAYGTLAHMFHVIEHNIGFDVTEIVNTLHGLSEKEFKVHM